MTMRLLSVNLWNLNPPLEERMDVLDVHIHNSEYDVICFQEVSPLPGGELQIDKMKSLRGYHVTYQETGSWLGRSEGLAILTRMSPLRMMARRLPGAESDMDRGLISVTLKAGSSVLTVLNTHLAFRVTDERLRLAQAAVVRDVIGHELSSLRGPGEVALCCDLNDVPGSPTFCRVSGDSGLVSAFNDDQLTEHSFSAANPYVKEELVPNRRIDHVFVSSGMNVSDARLVLNGAEETASDHYGLAVDLEV